MGDQWWLEVLMEADAETWQRWATKIGNRAIYSRYSEWFDRSIKGRALKETAQGIGTHRADHFKLAGMEGWPKPAGRVDCQAVDGAKLRDHAKRFPSLAECRAGFERATRTTPDWPVDDDDDSDDADNATTAESVQA